MNRLERYGTSGGERADAVDHCRSSIARLSNEVQDASSYIPAYDQRTYGEAIKALNTKLQTLRSSFAPKPKFAFKSGTLFSAKKNESAISLNDAAELASQKRRQGPENVSDISNESSLAPTPAGEQSLLNEGDSTEMDSLRRILDAAESNARESLALHNPRFRQPSLSKSSSVSITNEENIHIILPSSASHATSTGHLSNIDRCIIDMFFPTTVGTPFSGLTLKNISSSLIICGRVNGAAHLTNIQDSVVVVASRQFRMHRSSNCDVYLFTTSRPIIEDSTAIRFAPIPDLYLSDKDGEAENQWSTVDDFNWLKNEQSPNWNVTESSKRIPEGIWRKVVPGGPDLGVEDILNAVNIFN